MAETELESLRIQLNKANYELSNVRTEAERTKLRFEDMLRDRDTQILIEQKKSEDLQKDRKFLFEKQQSQATELLTLQDEYANYKVTFPPYPLLPYQPLFEMFRINVQLLMVVGSGKYITNSTQGRRRYERSSRRNGRTSQ